VAYFKTSLDPLTYILRKIRETRHLLRLAN